MENSAGAAPPLLFLLYFATELALLICLQAEVPREHPLLARAVAHLEESQDGDGGWPSSCAEHWRGWTTVQSLLVLRAFGRI